MKTINLMLVIACLVILLPAAGTAKNVDISGTWEGSTVVPNATEEDELTLVLAKDSDSYTGTISDSMGMAQDAELQEVDFSGNTLTFNFTIDTGNGSMQVDVTLTVAGDTMTGAWSIEDGSSGDITLKKQD
jgi:hypothetical protein